MNQRLYRLPEVSKSISDFVDRAMTKEGYLERLLEVYSQKQPILVRPIYNAPYNEYKQPDIYTAWLVLSILRKLDKQAEREKKILPVVDMETLRSIKEDPENPREIIGRFQIGNPHLIESYIRFWHVFPQNAKEWLLQLPAYMLRHIEEQGERNMFRASSTKQ